MSDFVDRPERELLAAGRRSPRKRLARRAGATVVMAAPVLLSIGVVGAIAAVILGSRHARHLAAAQRGSAPVGKCWRPPHNIRNALAPSTDAAPSPALLSLLGVLRRPATENDRVTLRGLVYTPITAVYARYIRVVSDAAGERFALVPAQLCGRVNGGMYPARPPGVKVDAPPQDALFIIVLGAQTPRPLFEGGDAAAITSGRSIGQWWPQGDGSLIATVVPDGVSRVMLSFGSHRRALSMTVRDNVAVRRPSPRVIPLSSTWYGPNDASSVGSTSQPRRSPLGPRPLQGESHDLNQWIKSEDFGSTACVGGEIAGSHTTSFGER